MFPFSSVQCTFDGVNCIKIVVLYSKYTPPAFGSLRFHFAIRLLLFVIVVSFLLIFLSYLFPYRTHPMIFGIVWTRRLHEAALFCDPSSLCLISRRPVLKRGS
jgi:hypothetical protein